MRQGCDEIWVIVDQMTKFTYFLSICTTDLVEKLCRLYVDEIIRLHQAPISIVFDHDPNFISHFWSSLQKAMETNLSMSTAFRSQADGQSEHTIQTLVDMLRSCVLNFGGSWEDLV